MAVMGQPAKYSMCVGENEEDSPWEPLHVQRGCDRRDSAVTVIGISGCFNILGTTKPKAMLREVAEALSFTGSNDYRFGGQPTCALNPRHATVLSQAGYDKRRLQEELFELSKKPVSAFASAALLEPRFGKLGSLNADSLVPFADCPEDIILLVAGPHGAGVHNLCLPSFGNTRAVTVAL
jgi:hypothetical protein